MQSNYLFNVVATEIEADTLSICKEYNNSNAMQIDASLKGCE